MTTTVEPPDTSLDLIAATITARTAALIGAPHLATRAARRAATLAALYVIELSPAVAATSTQAEEIALTDVRTTSSLIRLLHPSDEDES